MFSIRKRNLFQDSARLVQLQPPASLFGVSFFFFVPRPSWRFQWSILAASATLLATPTHLTLSHVQLSSGEDARRRRNKRGSLDSSGPCLLLPCWSGGSPRIAPGTDGEREVFEDHEARPSQRRRGGSWHVAAAEATRYGRSLRSAMASTRQLAR